MVVTIILGLCTAAGLLCVCFARKIGRTRSIEDDHSDTNLIERSKQSGIDEKILATGAIEVDVDDKETWSDTVEILSIPRTLMSPETEGNQSLAEFETVCKIEQTQAEIQPGSEEVHSGTNMMSDEVQPGIVKAQPGLDKEQQETQPGIVMREHETEETQPETVKREHETEETQPETEETGPRIEEVPPGTVKAQPENKQMPTGNGSGMKRAQLVIEEKECITEEAQLKMKETDEKTEFETLKTHPRTDETEEIEQPDTDKTKPTTEFVQPGTDQPPGNQKTQYDNLEKVSGTEEERDQRGSITAELVDVVASSTILHSRLSTDGLNKIMRAPFTDELSDQMASKIGQSVDVSNFESSTELDSSLLAEELNSSYVESDRSQK